jgi:arylsulfatase A-like enzyme
VKQPLKAARGLTPLEATLAGAGTGLAVLLASGCAAIATRPSYRAALQHGAPWRLVLFVPLLFALAGVLGWALAAALGARGAARRPLALRGALLVSALVVLIQPWIAPPVPLLAWVSGPAGAVAVLAVPLLIAALLAGGRLALLLPAAAAVTSALLSWALLGVGADRAPPFAPADQGWSLQASAALVVLVLVAGALLAVLPLARGLSAATRGPAARALGLGLLVQLLLAATCIAAFGRPAASAPEAVPPRADRPPVLLIVADTLRADHVSGFGGAPELTPQLAALARDGTSFPTAWTAAPWTTPAFGSLLTGRLPLDHGAGGGFHGLQPLNPAVPTLAEELAARGWRTAMVATNPLLGRQLGLARGFARYEDAMPPEWYHPVASWLMDAAGLSVAYLPAHAQAARALEAIDAAAQDARSWCVLAHFMDTHWPQQSPSELRALEPEGLAGDYRAAARAVDQGVGELLDGLRARGLYDGALIVFTADHGEELDEGRAESASLPPWNLHGHTLHEELLHVPLIVKLPRGDARLGAPGMRREEPVSLLDVMPTLLVALGSLPPPGLAGRSLLDPPEPRLIFAEALRPDLGGQALAVRLGAAKLIVRALPPKLSAASQYELVLDPGERFPGPPVPGNTLFEALVVRCLRLAQAPTTLSPVPEAPLNEATLRQLQQLGYLR